MALKDELIKMLPEVYTNSNVMTEFVEAVGEFLDGFSGAIDNFKTYQDYENISETNIELLAEQFDIIFPRNISTDRKREFVSEAIDLYRATGTEKSLQRIFKLIGWKVVIDYCWIVDPSYYDTESEYILTNDLGGEVTLTKYDIIFGDEKVYGDNTFVDLYSSAGNKFDKRPIYGEEYSVYAEPTRFVKVPYIRIVVTEEDYELFTQDYIDPDSGKVFSYTEDENFSILEDIRAYFLSQARPTHVAIFGIQTPFGLSDTILYSLSDSAVETTLNVGHQHDGTLVYGQFDVDRYLTREQMGGFEYGTTTMNYYGVNEDAPEASFDRVYDGTVVGPLNHYLNRTRTVLTIDVKDGVEYNIMVTDQNGKDIALGNPNWQLKQSVIGNTGTPIADHGGGYYRSTIEILNKLATKINVTSAGADGEIYVNVYYDGTP